MTTHLADSNGPTLAEMRAEFQAMCNATNAPHLAYLTDPRGDRWIEAYNEFVERCIEKHKQESS